MFHRMKLTTDRDGTLSSIENVLELFFHLPCEETARGCENYASAHIDAARLGKIIEPTGHPGIYTEN